MTTTTENTKMIAIADDACLLLSLPCVLLSVPLLESCSHE